MNCELFQIKVLKCQIVDLMKGRMNKPTDSSTSLPEDVKTRNF